MIYKFHSTALKVKFHWGKERKAKKDKGKRGINRETGRQGHTWWWDRVEIEQKNTYGLEFLFEAHVDILWVALRAKAVFHWPLGSHKRERTHTHILAQTHSDWHTHTHTDVGGRIRDRGSHGESERGRDRGRDGESEYKRVKGGKREKTERVGLGLTQSPPICHNFRHADAAFLAFTLPLISLFHSFILSLKCCDTKV